MKTSSFIRRFVIPGLCLNFFMGVAGPLQFTPCAEAASSSKRVIKKLKRKIKRLNRQLIAARTPGPAPASIPTPGMALIPAGNFIMGDETGGGGEAHELPVRPITLSAYYIDQYEVTKGLWDEVKAWGELNGYTDLPAGGGQGRVHPVHTVYFYEVVKWCNAHSEMMGLTPVYYTNAARTSVYRSGNIALPESFVRWEANGFRLPTEAEWENAARGPVGGMTYPWGNTIDRSDANTLGSQDPFDAVTPATTPVGFYDGGQLPAGVDRRNGYGLDDVAGNVYEWCWDVYNNTWYGDPAARSTNPRGPTSNITVGSPRVIRGGAWGISPTNARCAKRSLSTPTGGWNQLGFRTVRSP